ncbi:MAG: type II toxin-antitoxin system RelE/ParE family toxin [Pseudomonadota bacterium]
MKPTHIFLKADAKINAFADYIASENIDASMRFLEAIEKTFDNLNQHPGIGSTRYAHLPLLEGLRVWAVSGFENYLIFYIERSTHVDVLRILHGARDIPIALREAY